MGSEGALALRPSPDAVLRLTRHFLTFTQPNVLPFLRRAARTQPLRAPATLPAQGAERPGEDAVGP